MDFAKIDLEDHQKLARLIMEKAAEMSFKKRGDFEKFRNSLIKEHRGVVFHNLYFVKAYNDLVREGKIRPNLNLLKLVQKRAIRTMSGVAPVTVLTKPFPCPGRCVYCPTDVRMPKSYLPSQPAAQRAFRQRFNPYTQVFVRLKALHITGHEVSKVELRVIGGTWSSYPKKYQTWFLKQCLIAMNEFHRQISGGKTDRMQDIVEEQIVESSHGIDRVNTVILRPLKAQKSWSAVVMENETASVRCIGINIETRPDFINENEIGRLRTLGVTKVEIGVQTTDDAVQRMTKRGHDLACVRRATALLKDAGFKLSYHMMPNLPGSTVELDKKMIGQLFKNGDYQPDYLKIYPCMVIPGTELSKSFRRGEYKPYDDKTLEDVLIEEMRSVPEWCRVDRVARDVPAADIEAGSTTSNIRQILEKKLRGLGMPCRDIRAREVMADDVDPANVELVVRKYAASGGEEIFLSFEDVENDKLVALLRLRFPGKTFLNELRGAALVREIHVYGCQIAVGERQNGEKQHLGWGTRLMKEAERLARQTGYEKIAVISGIGTRQYYKKLGYVLSGTYMVKNM
ncbi:tRNA uridine(34) 5-carboxymethylaminomethyl modification radical SAM/GNAT enzyme Elp3 [Candidatus Peregrinibacteria bacterium]|nr:tRNA uridine(34) 5-carboxymethylaminomethyl modification radical SAM/GNAT enzyme Elp3 [Candidatus Peregrinibacteria bacterium]